ncbi:MAG: Ig-like domain-containing protein [Syntrophomonas sp.]|nr:Ig-like domain-containing protein [Syntrophomonas sp.]
MNNRKKSRLWSIIIIAILSCALMALPLAAAGAGDGSGGGKNIALGLDASFPADGQKDVSLTGDIKLTFNKNVIFLGIRDANKTCFSLIASDGNKVPIEVIMADDQTTEGFEKRRDISVRPVQKLQPGTGYVVKVSPQLQAKNGTSLGHEVTVNFVTAGVASKPVEPAPTLAPTPTPEIGNNQADANQPATPPTENTNNPSSESIQSVVEKTQKAEDKVLPLEEEVQPLEENKTQAEDTLSATQPEEPKQKSSLPIALAAGAVIIVVLGYILYKRKNR